MTAPTPNPSPPTHPAPAGAPMRCVICHPATAPLPGELLTSLSKRMGRMTICADIFAALAECCLIQREHLIQSPGGHAGAAAAARTSPAVLILVHPRHMPDGAAVRLVEAIRQYAPSIALWSYDRGANPKLRAVVEEDVTRAFALPIPTVPAPSTTAPPAPLSGPNPNLPASSPAQNGNAHKFPIARPARASSLLTEDELRMLLSGDPLDSGPLPIRPPRAPGGAP